MFIVEEKNRIILHMDSKCKIKRIKGDFHGILCYLNENLSELTFDENCYLNFLNSSKRFNPENDVVVYDTGKMRNITISKKVIGEIGIPKTMEILFGYSFKIIKKISSGSHLKLFGDTYFQKNLFKIRRVGSIEDLIRLSLVPHSKIEDSLGLVTSHIRFPYVLGNYSKKAYVNNVSKGTDRDSSLSEKKAVSEAIERISCSIVNKDIHTFLKSKSSGMDISEIYADKVELKKHEDTMYYTWLDPVFGKNGKCSICTELLYYPYDGLLKSKIVNSNGVATHTTKRDAVEGGILELIERDAFMLAWLLKKNIYRINLDCLPVELANSVTHIRKTHKVELEIFIIKHDNSFPVCMLLGNHGEGSLISLGSGSSVAISIQKAMEEFIGTVGFFKRKRIVNKDVILEHIYAYLNGSGADSLIWLQLLPKMPITHVENFFKKISFQEMLSNYENMGITFHTFTYKNILNTIFHRYTVKSFSNTLIPIWFGAGIPEPVKKSKRLQYWQKRLGVDSLNASMHPFG